MTAEIKNHIVLVSSNRWNSAITEFLMSTATAFLRSGFTVTVICRKDTAAWNRISTLDCDVLAVKKIGFSSFFQMRKLIQVLQPRATFTFGGSETSMVNFLGKKCGKRFRFRGQNFHVSWKFSFGQKLSHFNFDGLITPCDWLNKKLQQTTKLKCNHIDLGMDEQKFKFLEQDRQKTILSLVARFDPIKGHRYFFRVFAKAMENWPSHLGEPILRLIGREENITIPQLRNWGKELGIEEYISIETSKIENMQEELNSTTMAIIPSLGSEVICRSAYEFLLCGCPIFVSGVGSLKETLKNPLFGHCYENKSLEETAELLLACIVDAHKETSEIRRMRSVDAVKFYSIATMEQKLVSLLER